MSYPKGFFSRIFGTILKDHQLDVEFRCLYLDKAAPRPKQFWAESLEEMEKLWPEIEQVSKRGYDVHFTPAARIRKWQGKKEHPLPDEPIVVCVWADLDVGKDKPFKTIADTLKQVMAVKPLPSIIVESGTGMHVYYLLRRPRKVSTKRLDAVLKALAKLLNGDKGAARAGRLMRVPNLTNWKVEAKRRRAKVKYMSKVGYRLRDLEAAWNDNGGQSKGADQSKEHKQKQSKAAPGKQWEFFVKHVDKLVLSQGNDDARGVCPFHQGGSLSFSVNVESGLWKCHSTRCRAKGNIAQFCKRMNVPLPMSAVKRFPRLRTIDPSQEWTGERVFDEVYKYLTSQVRFTRDWQPVAIALWALGTYLYKNFPCYGHLWFNSPTTHSGKTKALDVLWTVCYKATEPQLDPTAAVLFRFPSTIGGTLLLDEIDKLDPEKQSAVISVLNSYKSSGSVMRSVPAKDKRYIVEKFNVYCPKVIAGIENLPETLQDRCMRMYLHRKRRADHVERFAPDMFQEMEPLRNQIDAWAARRGMRITSAYRRGLKVPREADDRLKDMMEPLFAIATVLPKWVSDKLIEATRALARDRTGNEEESNAVVLGVQALRENFPDDEDQWRLRSDMALEIFNDDVPGIETKAQAQKLLRRLGLRSRRVRVGKHVLRSYVLSRRALDRLVERYGLEQAVVA
jgi:hypothetical protein